MLQMRRKKLDRPDGPSMTSLSNTTENSKMATHFPVELLDQPDSNRIEYFRTVCVGHPHLKESVEAVFAAIEDPADTYLAFLLGGTGAGKTTLIRKVMRELTERFEERDASGTMPVV